MKTEPICLYLAEGDYFTKPSGEQRRGLTAASEVTLPGDGDQARAWHDVCERRGDDLLDGRDFLLHGG